MCDMHSVTFAYATLSCDSCVTKLQVIHPSESNLFVIAKYDSFVIWFSRGKPTFPNAKRTAVFSSLRNTQVWQLSNSITEVIQTFESFLRHWIVSSVLICLAKKLLTYSLTVAARGLLSPGANVCFAAPPHQIGNIVTNTMMVICVKLWTVWTLG